jgi:hypothetical protein
MPRAVIPVTPTPAAPGLGARPNLAGFRRAQERKRELFGEDVTFVADPAVTFAAAVAVDPDTGRPYDPFAVPETEVPSSTVVRCGVAWRSMDAEGGAAGWVDRQHVTLIAPPEAEATVRAASEFLLRESRWQIESSQLDGLAGVDRLLVHGRKA